MMTITHHVLESILRRWRSTAFLCAALALTVALVWGGKRVSASIEQNLTAVSRHADLIVGARANSAALLLRSAFHARFDRFFPAAELGHVSWQTYAYVRDRPDVRWSVPLLLGHEVQNFAVIGTTEDYFVHFRDSENRKLRFAAGRRSMHPFDVVLGREVGKALSCGPGALLTLTGDTLTCTRRKVFGPQQPATVPTFQVAGILKRTGSSIDGSLIFSLDGMDAIERGSLPKEGSNVDPNQALLSREITVFFLGLRSERGILPLHKRLNQYTEEPLTAIAPAMTLLQVRTSTSGFFHGVEGLAFALLALVVGIMIATIASGLERRRHEFVGLARRGFGTRSLLGMFIFEAALIIALGCSGGVILVYFCMQWLESAWIARIGYGIQLLPFTLNDGACIGLACASVLLAGTLLTATALSKGLLHQKTSNT